MATHSHGSVTREQASAMGALIDDAKAAIRVAKIMRVTKVARV